MSRQGDPKMKFLLLFLSAVRPSVRPKKILLTLPLRPTSAVRPGANPIQWGQSYTHFYTLGEIYKHVLILSIEYSCLHIRCLIKLN